MGLGWAELLSRQRRLVSICRCVSAALHPWRCWLPVWQVLPALQSLMRFIVPLCCTAAGNDRIERYHASGVLCWSGNDDEAHAARHQHSGQGVISVTSNVIPGLFSSLMQQARSGGCSQCSPGTLLSQAGMQATGRQNLHLAYSACMRASGASEPAAAIKCSSARPPCPVLPCPCRETMSWQQAWMS
jgi:hypothetical protein